MKHFKNKEQGIIKYVVLIIAVIILIAYFRNDIFNLINKPAIKDALIVAISWIQNILLWIVGKLGWTSNQLK